MDGRRTEERDVRGVITPTPRCAGCGKGMCVGSTRCRQCFTAKRQSEAKGLTNECKDCRKTIHYKATRCSHCAQRHVQCVKYIAKVTDKELSMAVWPKDAWFNA